MWAVLHLMCTRRGRKRRNFRLQLRNLTKTPGCCGWGRSRRSVSFSTFTVRRVVLGQRQLLTFSCQAAGISSPSRTLHSDSGDMFSSSFRNEIATLASPFSTTVRQVDCTLSQTALSDVHVSPLSSCFIPYSIASSNDCVRPSPCAWCAPKQPPNCRRLGRG